MKSRNYVFGSALVLNALLAFSAVHWMGCASPTVDETRRSQSYTPTKSAKPIDAAGTRIALVAEFQYASDQLAGTTSPQRGSLVGSQGWGGPGLLGATQGNAPANDHETYKQGRTYNILDDIVASDLFLNPASLTVIGPDMDQAKALSILRNCDLEISVSITNSYESDHEYNRGVLRVIDLESGKTVKAERWDGAGDLPSAMQHLKDSLSNDFSGFNLKAACQEALHLDSSNLDSLLVAHDLTPEIAKERNRALIAANSTLIPGLLQTAKTAALVDVKVKIEQTILDLEHFSELAKENAEANAASGSDAQDQREMSLVYRERISILKPILASIKDELANRQR